MTTATAVPAQEQLLEAAAQLFYARGIQAVSMDEIRAASGLSLKRIYQLYPSKEELAVAFLRRRDIRWRARLSAFVDQVASPERRVLAVFEWLHLWFCEPDFHGCAGINAYGELSGTTPAVAAEVRRHKLALRHYLSGLVADAGHPASVAPAIFLLVEGAVVSAAIEESPRAATAALDAAAGLLAIQPAALP